jgi:Metallo-peptidase family M12
MSPQVPSAPLLLRGTAWVRHVEGSSASREIPIAATLYRRGNAPLLELGLPRRGYTKNATRGMVLIRAHLSLSEGRNLAPAREHHASASSFTRHQCDGGLPRNGDSAIRAQSAMVSTIRASTYQTIYLATDFDEQFASGRKCFTPSACNDKIVGLINQASLFYEKQFGIQLEVAQQFGPTAYSTTLSAYNLLSDFTNSNNERRGDIIHDGQNTGSDLIDLYQLYTGRDLDNFILGLAFVGTACTNELSGAADMIVSSLSDVIDPVTIAHETGHTLGASHTSAGIMLPSLGYPLPTSFSDVSAKEIVEHLGTEYGECRGGAYTTYQTPPLLSAELAPRSVALSIRGNSHGSFIFTTRLSAITPGCSVTLRAADHASLALNGTAVTNFEPRSTSTRARARVTKRIKARRPKDSQIYVSALYSCPDGNILEVSPPVKFDPNDGVPNSSGVSRAKWIRLLGKAF